MNKKQLDKAVNCNTCRRIHHATGRLPDGVHGESETLTPHAIVNERETNEEFVNQVATFRMIQDFWFSRSTESITAWDNYLHALDSEIAYTLDLKDRMLRDGVYFIETTTHTASLDGAASDLNTITPVIERKEA